MDEELIVTRERLRLLSLGYYISGGIGALLVSFLLIHLILFTIASFLPQSTWENSKPPRQQVLQSPASPVPALNTQTFNTPVHTTGKPVYPVVLFRIMAGGISVVILVGWTLGGLTILAGRCIAKRKHRTFVLIMAGVNCIWIPYGTLLGVASFLTLSAPKAMKEYPA